MAALFPQQFQQPMYPSNYNPYQIVHSTPSLPQINSIQSNSNSIVWVQGEAGAKAYPVAAGNTVMMLDSENAVFYLKTTDASGVPMPLRIFDFVERTPQNQIATKSVDTSNFITREEFEDRLSELKPKEGRKHENEKRQSLV